LLTAIGKPDWTATSADAFVQAALAVTTGVRDRQELRKRLQSSAVCDAASHTRSLELAYRQMLMEIAK
jgi:predicted O-linked N-acetylglucosamine transferase (SPINDLY family)